MHNQQVHYRRLVFSAALFFTFSSIAPCSYALDFGDMMNPNRWMNGNRDRADLPPPPPPNYAPPYVAPPAYYGTAPLMPAAPSTSAADKAEIEALKRRIEELEAQQRAQAAKPAPRQPFAVPSNELPAAPVFRPLDKN